MKHMDEIREQRAANAAAIREAAQKVAKDLKEYAASVSA